jgi:hypothetical protein
VLESNVGCRDVTIVQTEYEFRSNHCTPLPLPSFLLFSLGGCGSAHHLQFNKFTVLNPRLG